MHASHDDGLVPSKRIRRPLRFALVALAVAVLLVIGVLVFALTGASARDERIARLACQLVKYTPPGTEPGDDIRSTYSCGPYQVPTATPTSTRTVIVRPVRPGRRRARGRHPRPSPIARPSAIPSAAPSTPAGYAAPTVRNRAAAAPSSSRRPAPAPARTSAPPTRHRPTQGRGSSPARTPTPAPTPTGGGGGTGVVCTVGGIVGLPLCPKG